MYNIRCSRAVLLFAGTCFVFSSCSAAEAPTRPLIIAHRGSPCHLPEETLEGYKLAIGHAADYIEMDVVSTSDGHLICRHDLTLDDSTDVQEREEFSDRRRTVALPGGRQQSGFFTANFTLSEVRTLYARQAIPFRDQAPSHSFRVRTLEEVIQLAANSTAAGRPVGVYIETKGPTYHDGIGLPLESKLAAAVVAAWSMADVPVILQSFEVQSLEKVSRELGSRGFGARAKFIWLLDCDSSITDTELDHFANFGYGIGPDKMLVAPLVATEECGRPEEATCGEVAERQMCTGRLAAAAGANSSGDGGQLVQRAHARGLVVHAYTFRNEGRFMAIDFDSDPLAELRHFRGLGVDGVFVDCPSTAQEWLAASGGVRQSAAVASVSVIATLLAVTVVWGLVVFIRRRRQRRFRYDVFPSVFNTGDLTWYPPDYRRAVVPNQATEEEDELAHEPPLPTSIMLTPLDSPPRATDAPQRQQQQQQEQLRPGRTA